MHSVFDSSVYEWGLQVIYAVQTVKSDLLTYIMIFISFLSDPIAYLCFLPIFFWCVDERKTVRISLLVLFSASLNTCIKDFLQVPRPYVVDSNVGLIPETGYSTPSGHSQNSAAFYPYAISLFRKENSSKKRTIVTFLTAIFIPIIIGFSRIFLGVHYPSDVLLGWVLGFLLSVGAALFVPTLSKFITPLPKTFKILIVGLTAVLLNWIGPNDTSMSAAFFGLGVGYVYLLEKGGFNAKSGSKKQKILRVFIGLIIVSFLYFGLKELFPLEGEKNYHLYRFIRYFLVGFFASFIIPKLFIVLKLAQGRENNE